MSTLAPFTSIRFEPHPLHIRLSDSSAAFRNDSMPSSYIMGAREKISESNGVGNVRGISPKPIRGWHRREHHKILNGVFTRSSKLPANKFKIHVLMLDVCWIV